jgi:hypothetical protein
MNVNVCRLCSFLEKKHKEDKLRATVLLPGERGRKELMTRVAVRDAALIASTPSRTSFKSTAQAMNHAT